MSAKYCYEPVIKEPPSPNRDFCWPREGVPQCLSTSPHRTGRDPHVPERRPLPRTDAHKADPHVKLGISGGHTAERLPTEMRH